MTGTVSPGLVDQLVTMGFSTTAGSGSASSAGFGSSSVTETITFSNSTPPSSLVVLGLIPVYATAEPDSLIGSSPPCPTGEATPSGLDPKETLGVLTSR